MVCGKWDFVGESITVEKVIKIDSIWRLSVIDMDVKVTK